METNAFDRQAWLQEIAEAQVTLQDVITQTPLQKDKILSAQYQ
jgi:threonine dehydratase